MNTDWFIIPFLINLILIAYIKQNNKDYIKLILLSVVSYKTSNYIFKENKTKQSFSGIFLNIIYITSGAIFIFQVFQSFSSGFAQDNFLIIVFSSALLLLILSFFNKIMNFISGKIFMQEDMGVEYNHNINIFNQSLGLILLPVSILTAFTVIPNVIVYVGISLFILVYLLRIIRLIKINFIKRINILYMFLYLCTFEIIPILYIIKVFVLI